MKRDYVGKIALHAMLTAFIICPVHLLYADQAPKAQEVDTYVTIDADPYTTLKPLIDEIMIEGSMKVSEGLVTCYEELEQGARRVKMDDLLEAMPDVLYYLYNYNSQPAKRTGGWLSDDYMVTAALNTLRNVKAALEEMQTTYEYKYENNVNTVYKAIEELLDDMPQTGMEERLSRITRQIVMETGDGIKQIVERTVPGVNFIESCVLIIDSKVDDLDDKVCIVDSKVDVMDSKMDVIDSKIDIIESLVETLVG